VTPIKTEFIRWTDEFAIFKNQHGYYKVTRKMIFRKYKHILKFPFVKKVYVSEEIEQWVSPDTNPEFYFLASKYDYVFDNEENAKQCLAKEIKKELERKSVYSQEGYELIEKIIIPSHTEKAIENLQNKIDQLDKELFDLKQKEVKRED
jgi:hypothetical protein